MSRFRIAIMTVDGHAFSHALQPMHVPWFTMILNRLRLSSSQPMGPKGQKNWHQGR